MESEASEKPKLDIASWRACFPALGKGQEQQVFCDNAGGTQVLEEVVTTIQSYLLERNVQLGATYRVAEEATAAYRTGYAEAASFINASPDEIVLGPSTTQLLRNLSLALPLGPGDELVVSKLDHEANISPWVGLAARLGLTLKWWIPSCELPATNPKLDVASLEPLLSPRTRLVACTHVSNLLGSIHDVRAIAEKVHEVPGAMLCVDGVAYAPHRRVDVKALDVDIYTFSWYKVYGPHMAQLYVRRSLHPRLHSLGHFFHPLTTLESRLGLAGASYELVAALPAVARYFDPDPAATWAAIAAHEARLGEVLLGCFSACERITLFGEPSADPERRVPTFSFVVQGMKASELVSGVLERSRFGVRSGHMYAKRLVEEVLGQGEEGVVRVSLVHYNTEEEMKELTEVLYQVITHSMGMSPDCGC